MLPIFYTSPENINGDLAILTGEEAHHLQKVLRLTKGESAMIVDGCGNAYRTQIEAIAEKSVKCRIFAPVRNFGEPMHYVTLAGGLSTGYKFDEVIEKGTELGVSRFVPVITEKAKVRIDDELSGRRKGERWRKVAIAAMKQCGRSLIPAIEAPIHFEKLFSLANLGQTVIFDPTAGENSFGIFHPDTEQKYFTLIVGSESGFSAGELQAAREKGILAVSLGKRILRTENAGPTAAALLMFRLGEFR
ncbi:Ribosomal RNA small subunit methyltransferase E [Candidatus Zixiibacteriota bacterium]|nr:Ribosomal RNA small subunit methyltransferase E [candidate division Zixibacteria bacterium]